MLSNRIGKKIGFSGQSPIFPDISLRPVATETKKDAAGSPLAPSVTRYVCESTPPPRGHQVTATIGRCSSLSKFRLFDGLPCSATKHSLLPKDHLLCPISWKDATGNPQIPAATATTLPGQPVCQSKPMSSERAEWVKAPTLIRSTPVAAIFRKVLRFTPPEASS